ncbi:8-oxo-dGTP diphosphatase [Effusibacillus dendaii]|nr:8-oxo-dGTP diphosphatase [Effusibacillus dendaii]
MQMVANCILRQGDRILMLQKPRRGWWVAPGGKVEAGESLLETVVREFREETGLTLLEPQLRGVFTIVLEENGQMMNHWMLFTFYAESFQGKLHKESEEGHLEWVAVNSLNKRPMAEGDRYFLRHVLRENSLLTGKFIYTPDYQLIDWNQESPLPVLR